MGGKRRQWTFRTTEALVAWMEDEYLSEITLDEVDPLPGAGTPDEVRFTWSLHGTGNGAIVPYRARATGVESWTLTGARNDRAISVERGDGPAVHVVMGVPGRLELACASLVFTLGATKRPRRPRRPHTDYMYFIARGARAVTLGEVLDALGAPPDAEIRTKLPVTRATTLGPGVTGYVDIYVGDVFWIQCFGGLFPGETGHKVTVSRKAATDDEWRRAQELPGVLGSVHVDSAWEFQGTAQEWAATVGA